jgi:hypothetical protein
MERSPRYFRAVARAVGVPEFWIDDATQDMALAAWKDGKADDPLAIRREAIDAARRYGPVTRHGRRRPALVSLNAAEHLSVTPGDALELTDAMRSAFDLLTVKQRRALRRRLEALPMSSLDSAHASAARRKLRKELAGD